MTTGRAGMRIGAVLMSIGILAAGAGCASRQVASTSGDQSTTMKGKGETGAPVESVKQEPVASVETVPSRGGASPQGTQVAPSAPGSSVQSSGGAAVAAPSMTGLGDIYFDFDQYNIRSDARGVLENNAKWLRTEDGKALLIEGHCDERGTLAYNLVLGEKRAKSAKRYLEDLGIPGSRIQTTSYGEVRPFCKEHNEGCWSKNRRAHFVVR